MFKASEVVDSADAAHVPVGGASGVQTLDRAVLLLNTLASSGPGGLTKLTERSGLSKPTVARLLTSLRDLGLVEQDVATRRYRLGMSIFVLGSAAARTSAVRQCALPVLRQLAASSGQTTYIWVPHDDQALCVERVNGSSPLHQLKTLPGEFLPFHAGAAGRILLAWQGEERITELLARGLRPLTEKTCIDSAALIEELATVRLQGYAITEDDVTVGSCAVGAPVQDSDGQVIAALSVGIFDRSSDAGRDLSGTAQRVRLAAEQVAQSLSFATFSGGV